MTRLGRALAALTIAGSLAVSTGAVAVAAPALPAAAPAAVVLPAATTAPVEIRAIPAGVAPVGGKALVKPRVAVTGRATVLTKRITVKYGARVVANNVAYASLRPATYSVKTTVRYKPYTVVNNQRVYSSTVKTVTRNQTLTVRTAVAIRTLANRTVAYGGSAKIVPSAAIASGTKVLSKTLTVKAGTRVLALRKPSVTLRPGKYWVTTMVRYQVPGSTKAYAATKGQSLTISQRARTTRVAGTGSRNCPSGYPIKGNADSGIYHVPSGAYYDRTVPEECFSTERAAIAAGYRKSKL